MAVLAGGGVADCLAGGGIRGGECCRDDLPSTQGIPSHSLKSRAGVKEVRGQAQELNRAYSSTFSVFLVFTAPHGFVCVFVFGYIFSNHTSTHHRGEWK